VNSWQRWIKAPHTTRFRRILFQVHLWMGIGLGLYILVISVSGSAVVLRPQINRGFIHNEVEAAGREGLTGSRLEAAILDQYMDYQVLNIIPPTREGRAVYVSLERNGEESGRYFDQYDGADLGSSYPWQVHTVEWLTLLHDDLLMDRALGRKLNGFGGMFFLLMVFSGILIWWQGKRRWKEGLVISGSSRRGLLWQLHSFLGFWALLFMLVWGVTAIYFAFPQPFDALIDAMDPDLDDFERPDGWLLFLIDLHFGRFRGAWPGLPYLWTILGLLPAVMFISGFILWYQRVLKRQRSADSNPAQKQHL